ncbi:MAG TPA: hypothetical protein VFS97_03555 [Nitrososphaeraceae archaeon]|nr:hypothetical protein [Nitrososphaeraceae archaeon]
MRCISCDSPDYKILDNVGNRRYYRCNRCGLEWNRKIEQIEANNKVNEDYLRGLPRK